MYGSLPVEAPPRATIAPGPRLGPIGLRGRAILAPMAGITDVGMRRLAWRHGAALTVTEMAASDYLAKRDPDCLARLAGDAGQPLVAQIAGCGSAALAEAARIAVGEGAVAIDINMGCPAKRVTGGYAGSALMRDLDGAARLIASAVAAVSVPVTVKMRLGWDETTLNAPDLAGRAEREGAALVTVHARTRSQFYTGRAEWAAVAAVKAAVGIPVVVNGDCQSVADARAMLASSGADAVMIGRGALGRPWFVGQVAESLRTGRDAPPPPAAERRDAALEHYDAVLTLLGTARGVRHARKHVRAYVDDALGAGVAAEAMRRQIATSDDPAQVVALLRRAYDDSLPRAAA